MPGVILGVQFGLRDLYKIIKIQSSPGAPSPQQLISLLRNRFILVVTVRDLVIHTHISFLQKAYM